MAGAFRTPVDIGNRALQLLRRPAIYTFDDKTVEAREVQSVYDPLRQAELRRALWVFSTRRVILRPLDFTTETLVAPDWSSTANYIPGDMVNYGNQRTYWLAQQPNTGQTPGEGDYWESYFGPLTVVLWDDGTSYFTDELVYTTPDDGTYTVYRSLVNGNENDPAAVDVWSASTQYDADQVVSYSGTPYQSLIDFNHNLQPDTHPSQWTTSITAPAVSNSWRAISGAVLNKIYINYPLGAGPAADTRTMNIFQLPAGYLRQAPSDPKAGINPYLGGPVYNMEPDWVFEAEYILSHRADPIMLRFVADIQSVASFDSLFAEGLATRIALELAGRLADAEHVATIISMAREEYARTISEARTVNGIAAGSVTPYEDEYVTVRL